MVLAIDIGNTNIVAGGLTRDHIFFTERISTLFAKTELEYAVDIKTILDLNHVAYSEITGCIIASVVPQITTFVRLAAEKILDITPLVLGPGVKTGLNILMDNPASVGADLVAGAVAGIHDYRPPLIIIDLGTATTLAVVDRNGNYIGGMIMPGIGISLDALTAKASQLSGIGIEPPRRVISKNTPDSMKSGIVYGTAGALDGCIERIEEELGEKATIIATGGLAGSVIPYCRRDILVDEELLLKGLYLIYEKNNAKNPAG